MVALPELADAYAEHLPLLRDAALRLQNTTQQHCASHPRIDRVSFRAKEPGSFLRKANERRVEPPYREPLLEVEDQIAGRIVVFFLSDVDRAVELAVSVFGAPVEIERKVPARDAEFGYESYHSIFDLPDWAHPNGWDCRAMPTMFELQVRTLFQHAYAEPQHDLAYKPQEPLTRSAMRELAWIAASAWGADRAYERVRGDLSETA